MHMQLVYFVVDQMLNSVDYTYVFSTPDSSYKVELSSMGTRLTDTLDFYGGGRIEYSTNNYLFSFQVNSHDPLYHDHSFMH